MLGNIDYLGLLYDDFLSRDAQASAKPFPLEMSINSSNEEYIRQSS